MRCLKIVFVSIMFLQQFLYCWTWSYKQNLKPEDFFDNQKEIVFEKKNTSLFTQLIFSWNALRPKRGYLSFYVQVHTYGGGWSEFYHMLDWGNGVQKSYLHKHDNKPSFYHVRLEMHGDKLADAFRIKIKANEGAVLADLRLLSVSISDFSKFKPEYHRKINYKSVFINNVPKISQFAINHEDSPRICSPTSITMLLGYLSKKEFDPIRVAKGSFDDGLSVYGSWPFNVAHAFELFPEYNFRVVRLKSFRDIYLSLKRGLPVVVSIRGPINGGAKPYDSGHLIIVIGWDNKKHSVIVHDPAFETDYQVFKKYHIKDFLKAWEKSNRLAYVVEIN